MRAVALIFALFFFASMGASSADDGKVPAKGKTSPDRLRAMKAALADIEKGILRQVLAYPFAPPPYIGAYADLAKQEYGIQISLTRDLTRDENGYNQVMLMEIEHRFGRGVLTKLMERAEAEHKKNQR